jgi:hypothetical protein
MAGIESCDAEVCCGKTVLLFLPEGEHHELGLLYMHYLLKNRGVSVLYLGANVPVKDIGFVVGLKKPQWLYTHLTCISESFNFTKWVSQVASLVPAGHLVVSGHLTQSHFRKVPPNVELKRSLPQVIDFVHALTA